MLVAYISIGNLRVYFPYSFYFSLTVGLNSRNVRAYINIVYRIVIIPWLSYVRFMFVSDWSNFTSCLSTNDVTFDDMHQYLSTYQFSDYYYNGSIASYYFFCTHIEGESARRF